MKHTKILLLALFTTLLLFQGAAEETEALEAFNETVELDELQEEINNNQDEIPGFIETIVGGQTINIYFNNTDYSYSADLDGTEVQELSYSELDEPTLEMWINVSTLESILQPEEDIFDEIEQALDEGNIEYETLSARNTIVFFITETILDITSALGITG